MATKGGFDTNHTRSSQEQLAASLIDCLGVDGAIYACQANAWEGVLRHVLPYRQDAETQDGGN